MKEATRICDWMRANDMLFDMYGTDLDTDLMLGRQVRRITLYLLMIMLERYKVSPADAVHKIVKEKSSSGNVLDNDGNDISPAQSANTMSKNMKAGTEADICNCKYSKFIETVLRRL